MAEPTLNTRKDLTRGDTAGDADCGQAAAMISSGDSAQLSSTVPNSPFFKLSPELSNRIYRLVLIKDDLMDDFRVVVDKVNGIPEPALLLSSKTIRYEASGIFYYENSFCCCITRFDPAPILLLQSKFTMPFRDHPNRVYVERKDSSVNWKNLVSWLHMCHEGECVRLDMYEDGMRDGGETRLLEGLFDVATSCPDISSSTLDIMIESMLPALEEINLDWWNNNFPGSHLLRPWEVG